MTEWYSNIEEIYDDHEDQEHTNVENDYIDTPWEPFQPIDNAESTQKLSKVLNYAFAAPLVSHL